MQQAPPIDARNTPIWFLVRSSQAVEDVCKQGLKPVDENMKRSNRHDGVMREPAELVKRWVRKCA